MTDDQPELSPARDAAVRRLLAEARHTDPMPPEVADRLDRVLTDLATEPAREARVVRLADRRRRAGTMLVAAAAVVVAGFGIGQVVGGDDAGEDATSAEEVADEPAAQEAEPEAAGADRDGTLTELREGTVPVRLRPDRFAEDVERLQELSVAAYDARGGETSSDREDDSTRLAVRSWCDPGDWGRGTYRPVRYGKAEGWVVLRQPQGDTRVVDLFLCGSELTVRSVTLPSS